MPVEKWHQIFVPQPDSNGPMRVEGCWRVSECCGGGDCVLQFMSGNGDPSISLTTCWYSLSAAGMPLCRGTDRAMRLLLKLFLFVVIILSYIKTATFTNLTSIFCPILLILRTPTKTWILKSLCAFYWKMKFTNTYSAFLSSTNLWPFCVRPQLYSPRWMWSYSMTCFSPATTWSTPCKTPSTFTSHTNTSSSLFFFNCIRLNTLYEKYPNAPDVPNIIPYIRRSRIGSPHMTIFRYTC